MSDDSIFSLEQDYSSRTSLNPDFVKEKYDYDVRMFKFDKSLAIIPNFQFAENAVINNTRKTNWVISWVITLQYDTTIDQLKIIRDEIEDHIKNG